jgi:hypothetical protein
MKLTSPLKGVLVALALVSLGVSPPAAQGQGKASDKPRLVITADPELDDVNTLIRAILYTTDFKLEIEVRPPVTTHTITLIQVQRWRMDR